MLGVALAVALAGCAVADPPFVASPPPGGTVDGGAVADGGLFVLYAVPTSGTDMGGSTVTIIGGGFAPDASVSFGVLEATNTTVSDPSTIYAFTPPSPAGVVDITVENPDGGKAVLTGGYDFLP
jgi:hypothetical protein